MDRLKKFLWCLVNDRPLWPGDEEKPTPTLEEVKAWFDKFGHDHGSGSHLGRARNWIQWNCRNGELVTWGSNEFLQVDLTPAKVDQLAMDIKEAVVQELSEKILRFLRYAQKEE